MITTVDELGSSLAQVTPTAAAMGVSFENVGASLANMTAKGTPTAQATTQLNSLIAELGKNGTTASKNLEKAAENTEYAGMGFKEMMDAGVPLNEVLDLMGTYAEKNNVDLLDMFSSIEAGKGALALAGENSALFAENLAAMSTEADVVEEAYKKVTDTFDTQFGIVITKLKNLGITIFDKFSDPMTDGFKILSDGMDELAEIINNFDLDEFVDNIKNMYEIFMDLLPIIVGVSTSLASFYLIVQAGTIISTATELFNLFKTSILGVNAALAANPIGVIIALIAGLVMWFITAYTTSEEFRDKVNEIFTSMIEFIMSIINSLIEFFTVTIPEALNNFLLFWQGIWTSVSNFFKQIFDGLVLIAKNPINLIIGMINAMINGINFAISKINTLSFEVPWWVPGLGGSTWGFNMPLLQNVPYLAKGAVLKPNNPFLAMVGDQTSGVNIEAPLETIKQGFREELMNIKSTLGVGALFGLGGTSNNSVTNNSNSNSVVQNFYSQIVSPFDSYRKAVGYVF